MGLIRYKSDKSSRYSAKTMDWFLTAHPDYVNSAIGRLYSFSNEDLTSFFKNMDVSGKSVLTVGSSGDQVLSAIMSGASRITLVDANPMSLPYTELKLAAAKILSFEEFKKYFTREHIFDHKYYAKVSHDLSPRSREFWDEIMLNTSDYQDAFFKNIFQQQLFMESGRDHMSYFKSEQNFLKLKENIPNCDVDFICAEFNQFPSKITDKYDLIMLSNLVTYLDCYQRFWYITKKLSRNLRLDGKMQVNYEFDKSYKKFESMLDSAEDYLDSAEDMETIERFRKEISEREKSCLVGDYELIVHGKLKNRFGEYCKEPSSLVLKKGFFDKLNIVFLSPYIKRRQPKIFDDPELTK